MTTPPQETPHSAVPDAQELQNIHDSDPDEIDAHAPTTIVPAASSTNLDSDETIVVAPISAGENFDDDGITIPGLEGYSKVQLIAHGSSAIVYRAQQDRLKRPVAIKLLLIDDVMTTVEGVQFELEMLVRLSQQASIVGIIDTGMTDAGQPYIVMEYCEGGSYAQILKESGPLPVEDVLEVGIKIGEALHAAHEVGIIHRDVKPGNILLSRFGPKLTDFGIAYNDELSATTTFMKLTPHHASPETLLQQHQTGRSDLYSLASTMWNLLAGKPPFAGPRQNPEEFRRRVLTQPVPRIPRDDVPDWLQAELSRAMAKRPAHRHLNAMEFAETLRTRLATSRAETPWAPPMPPDDSETIYVPRSSSPASPGVESVSGEISSPTEAAVISPGGYLAASGAYDPSYPPVMSQPAPGFSAPVLIPSTEPEPEVHPAPQWIEDDSSQEEKPASWRRILLAGGIAGIILGLLATVGVLLMRGTPGDDPESPPKEKTTPTQSAQQIDTDEFIPKDVQVNVDGDQKATVRWNDVSNGRASFVILVKKNGESQSPGGADSGSTSATIAEPLDKDAEYCFTATAIVVASAEVQYVSMAEPVCITT